MHPGGGGVNVSRAIHALGGKSRPLLAYGGHNGEILIDLLKKEGLDPVPLGVSHPTRESFTVRDEANGLQYRFMMPGPAWTPGDVAIARATITRSITPGALVIPSGSLPPGVETDFFVNLNPDVRANGGRMILDTSGPALRHASKTRLGLFVLRMDLSEARELSGAHLTQVEDVANLATRLRQECGAEIVLIAAGGQGTVIACENWRGLTRPPPVMPVSKVGAGDSFIGAFALSITRGEDPLTACAWGTAAATSAVTTEGTALCVRADTERFFQLVTRTEI